MFASRLITTSRTRRGTEACSCGDDDNDGGGDGDGDDDVDGDDDNDGGGDDNDDDKLNARAGSRRLQQARRWGSATS